MDNNFRIISRRSILINQIERFLLAFIPFGIGWMFGYEIQLETDSLVARFMCRLLEPIGFTSNMIPLLVATYFLFLGSCFPLYSSEKFEMRIRKLTAALKNKACVIIINIINFAKAFGDFVKVFWFAAYSVVLGWLAGCVLMVTYGPSIADALNTLFNTTIFVPDMLPPSCALVVAFLNYHDFGWRT